MTLIVRIGAGSLIAWIERKASDQTDMMLSGCRLPQISLAMRRPS